MGKKKRVRVFESKLYEFKVVEVGDDKKLLPQVGSPIRCPLCGSQDFVTSLKGCFLTDQNRVTCSSCKETGVAWQWSYIWLLEGMLELGADRDESSPS